MGLASPSVAETLQNEGAREGLTVWRILSGYPHYKLVTDYDEVGSVSLSLI